MKYLFQVIGLLCLMTACINEQQYDISQEQIDEVVNKAMDDPIIYKKGGITLTELRDIPPFDDINLALVSNNVDFRQGDNVLSFDISKFNLGERTVNENETNVLVNPSGQYLSVERLGAARTKTFSKNVQVNLNHGVNYLYANLVRSYNVSLRSDSSFVFVKINTESNEPVVEEKSKAYLNINFPSNGDKFTERQVLLDFTLLNAESLKKNYQVEVLIDETKFIVGKQAPYVISGLEIGKHKIVVVVVDKDTGKEITGELLQKQTVEIEIRDATVFD